MCDVVLVSMPYAGVERPSLALSLLKASLERDGIPARVTYSNVRFAERSTLPDYLPISASGLPNLAADWVFAAEAFPDAQLDDVGYLRRVEPEADVGALQRARELAPAFLEEEVGHILAHRPRIVGCTSLLHQHVASLALLRRLHLAAPEVVTMLGGSHCEGSMGRITHARFPWVDYVVSGEADELIAGLCHTVFALGRGATREDLPAGVLGPCHRTGARSGSSRARATVGDLDATPIPDYSDFFVEFGATRLSGDIDPGLPFETSRGCWWGQRRHCTFCGLNGESLDYRVKSPKRTLREARILSERYGIRKFMAVDNILSLDYFETVLPAWARQETKYEVLYETKANLRREQVKLLADAGVRWIQPGIESLHDGILGLLNKGTRAALNIQLLKWCSEFGLDVMWNMLVQVPGDRDEWYEELADVVPLLRHLPPPAGGLRGLVPVRFDRFSAYVGRPEAYGLRLSPHWSYRHVYPMAAHDLEELAYFFEDHGRGPQSRPALERLARVTVEWVLRRLRRFQAEREGVTPNDSVRLDRYETDGAIRIEDTRPCAVAEEFCLRGLEARVYDACETVKSRDTLLRVLRRDRPDLTWREVGPVLSRLAGQNLVLELGGLWIGLAVRAPRRPVPPLATFPGGYAHLRAIRKRMAKRGEATVFEAFRVEPSRARGR